MPAIYPITTARVSDALIQARLLSQFAFDQSELLRLQDQLSTGYRISTPSQDAPAAIRAITLQRLMEQKQQSRVNLNTTDSFVNATDTALVGAHDLLTNVKALALRSIDSTATPEMRAVLQAEVRDAIKQFVDIGNRTFRGRYLFAGSANGAPPFENLDKVVSYTANETELQNFVELDQLFTSNVTGAQAFGAVSPELRGTADLNPIVTNSTRLADLRGGRGITKGSFQISDGTSTVTIDLSSAETVGDVMELITNRPPSGRDLNVTLSGNGLVIDLDDAGGGNLSIFELPGGTTAAELGILRPNGVGVNPLVGDDLDPILRRTTRLADLLGTRAVARATFAGLSNDIWIEAAANGAEFNNTQITFVSGATGDSANASYDSGTNILTVQISAGVTRAVTAIDAINATGVFTARRDFLDDTNNDGSGVLQLATFATAGGSGENLDKSSGIRVVNGNQTSVITFDTAETVEDLLNILNSPGTSLLASINASGTGIDIRTRLSGADFSIGENGGTTAAQLGIRSLAESDYLSDLNFGLGITDLSGDRFAIQRRDGVTLEIDLSTAVTVGDVLNLINNHAANVGNVVVARLARIGNGIELEDANATGPQDLTVFRRGRHAAWGLGLVPKGEEQAVATSAGAGLPQILTGTDVNPQEAKGVFNSLLRLDQALDTFDLTQIERAVAMIDQSFTDLSFVRAELGAQARTLSTLKYRIELEDVEIRSTLSNEIDTDYVRAISDLTARQANMQATLQLIGITSQLTVLNFL